MADQPEIVFEVLAEGGSLCISRRTVNGKTTFLYNHQEADLTDEGLGINRKYEFATFQEAFRNVNKYGWYGLHLSRVHTDYSQLVLEKLIEKLNEIGVKDRSSIYSLGQSEEVLSAIISYQKPGGWKYIKTDIRKNDS